MGEHIAVLSNPFAGKGRGRQATERAVARLRERGSEVRVYIGESAQDAQRLAAQAVNERPRALVVVGGDGTLAGILDAIADAAVPVVLVPAGTGNDLARSLELPRSDPAAAVDLVFTGIAREIDLGEVRSGARVTPFLTVAALGFDARVSDRTNRLRWPPGALRYYLALLIELIRLRPTDFRITIDDGAPTMARGTLIAVGNTESYGGGMPMCRGAVPDDGVLDVVTVGVLSRRRLVRVFPVLLQGRHFALPEVRTARARRVHIDAPGLIVYADGERIGEESCTIGLRRRALTVLVPLFRKPEADR
ncbi:diacylglycerol kinase [Microbacterium hydrocarbonoxydans]|uniref:diacylglycerol kinase n=1 Tax=Microbacterium hydrocarbonoxydans TaxID=273678 RepID=UPI0013DC9926|nr:diacylglycerol kinase [Microbacterium hydrocarbonoxydans]